ncbi:enediyne biosynthesis protein [Micromonospora sp. NPDC003776]
MTDTQEARIDGSPLKLREWDAPAVPPASAPPAPSQNQRDPRYLALRNFAISISVFNVLGYTVLGFEQPWAFPLLAVATGYAVELLLELASAWGARRRPAFLGNGPRGLYTYLLPAHITALAVNMLLYTNDRFGAVAFGVVVAIGAKYVLRAPIYGKMRHFMNPSNFGITVTLLVFSSWIAIAPPYEFTEQIPDVFSLYIPLVIATAGTVINAQLTKKIPLIAGWVGSFVIQALLRHYIWDVELWTALAVVTGVAFVLFTNYMITDPGTTPRSGRAQFMFGSSVGIVYGILMLFNVVYTLFFALTAVCLARGLYWWARWFLQARAERRAGGHGAVQPE